MKKMILGSSMVENDKLEAVVRLGTKEEIRRQCAEFEERCRTLPEYFVYRRDDVERKINQ